MIRLPRTLLGAVGLALLLPGPPARASVAEVTLLRLLWSSPHVVVGRVLRVEEVPTAEPAFPEVPTGALHLAELEVEQRLRGPDRARLRVLTDATWLCDESRALPGERALFFLHPCRDCSDLPREAARALAAAAAGAEVLQIAWSGYGRLPLSDVAGAPYADVHPTLVRLPSELESLPADPPLDYAGLTRRVRLAPLLDWLAAHLPRPQGIGEPAARVEAALLAWVRDPGDLSAQATLEALDAAGRDHVLALARDPASPWRAAAAPWAWESGWVERWQASADPVERRAWAYARQALSHLSPLDGEGVRARLVAAAVGDDDDEVRWRALDALVPAYDGPVALDDAPACEVVAAALGDPAPAVRRQAAASALALGRGDWARAPQARRRALESLRVLRAEGDLRPRRLAWEALAHLGDEQAFEAADQALSDPDPELRRLATLALGSVPGVRALRTLVGQTGAPEASVRAAAVRGLSRRSEAERGALVAWSLHDADARVRAAAAQGLRSEADGIRGAAPLVALILARSSAPQRRAELEDLLRTLR